MQDKIDRAGGEPLRKAKEKVASLRVSCGVWLIMVGWRGMLVCWWGERNITNCVLPVVSKKLCIQHCKTHSVTQQSVC